ncbi:dimethyl sulfoxide reductase anchor subunit family protein [Desulfobaculum sp. SPO524]|uniref:dimethyl sulfoxide reductase anchor subunit family protein n=1 Tax=Desulfobaculum sp. SPO524 TaxID=3378071 RepID=UPI00385517CC
MNSMELPLVFFTVLSQMAVGMTVFAALVPQEAAAGAQTRRTGEMAAIALLCAGLVASVFHLGHPLGAPRALVNIAHSWLSREILAFGAFAFLMIVSMFVRSRAVSVVVPVVGLAALGTSALAYMAPSIPALDNAVPGALFAVTAAMLGVAGFGALLPAAEQERPARILGGILALALVLHLLIPSIWLSGSTPMRMTGTAWLESSLYWVRGLVGLALPLAFVLRTRRIPLWLPALLLVTELLFRVVFFAESVHTASLIGTM